MLFPLWVVFNYFTLVACLIWDTYMEMDLYSIILSQQTFSGHIRQQVCSSQHLHDLNPQETLELWIQMRVDLGNLLIQVFGRWFSLYVLIYICGRTKGKNNMLLRVCFGLQYRQTRKNLNKCMGRPQESSVVYQSPTSTQHSLSTSVMLVYCVMRWYLVPSKSASNFCILLNFLLCSILCVVYDGWKSPGFIF